jgi:hypothetical protein
MTQFAPFAALMFGAPQQPPRVGFYGTSTQECLDATKVAQDVVAGMPNKGEQVVVVCGDSDFERIDKELQLAPRQSAFSGKADGKYTIMLRSSSLLHEPKWNPGYTPEHIITHEYGHVVTGSPSEQMAEDWALKRLKK